MVSTYLSLAKFRERFLKGTPGELALQTTPLQIYPLSLVAKHLHVPYPLVQFDFNLLIFIQKGRAMHQIGAESVDIQGRSAVFVPMGTFHSVSSLSSDIEGYFITVENKVFNAIFTAEAMSSIFSVKSSVSLDGERSDWVATVCRLLHQEVRRDRPNRKVGHGLLQALFYKLIELSGKNNAVSRSQEVSVKFKNLVQTHFREHKTVDFYSKRLAISANYLNRCIREIFHKSAKEVIIETSIMQSQVLMFDTSKSISEIAYELNFEDPSYFSRVFKKVTGRTPSAYRHLVDLHLKGLIDRIP